MPTLPPDYCNRMQQQLGGEYAAYLRALEQTPLRTLRVNTRKLTPEKFGALCDFELRPVPGLPASFAFGHEVNIGAHPLHMAGLCYVQEPSAQLPAALLGVEPGMTTLDLCASPGGKSGQIAAALAGRGVLYANEPVTARANILQFNLERLGVTNAVVTAQYPESLCPRLIGHCDRVLVDAPCSGEGMFRKEPAAVSDWSTAHVAACAKRQRGILDLAAGTVKPGGKLVYSTCTFSPEENEDVVEGFLAAHPAFHLAQMRRLYPHTFPGEGQFMALLVRADGDAEEPLHKGMTATLDGRAHAAAASRDQARRKRGNAAGGALANNAVPAWEAFCAQYLTAPPPGRVCALPDGRVFLLPPDYDGALSGGKLLRCGILAGSVQGARFTPDHALFLALDAARFCRQVALSGQELDAFLAGETIPCDAALSGWCAVTVGGYCVGFGKAVVGTLKNHLPKGLRRARRG